MGLIGGIARTAVIAGTATATSNAVNRRQAERNAAAYQQAQASVSQQYQTPPPSAAQSSADDTLAKLERLSQLRAQGILTDAEFSQQKAVILGS